MKDKRPLGIFAAVGTGTFMAALDASVVNLIMPLIKEDFGVSLSMLEWIATSYLLVVSSLLLTFGRLGDLYGQKRIYLTGFVIFIVGSALCGFSAGIAALIAMRVIQALGAAMLFSAGPAIVTNAVSPANRGRGLSFVAMSVALGLSSGPVLGGLLATHAGWPSIFFINVPVGLAGALLTARFVPGFEGEREKARFDVAGSVLVFFALLLLMLPLSISGDYSLSPVLFTLLLAAGALLIVVFILFERRHPSPMLDVRLFKSRVFAGSNGAALLVYMASYIHSFLTPFYLQTLRGYTPSHAGLLYLPMPLASMLAAPVSGGLSDRADSRLISALGALVMAGGLLMLSSLEAGTSSAYIVTAQAVTGLGFGIFQTPNNSAIMGSVPASSRGTASGTLATMRNMGMALGIALAGALFSYHSDQGSMIYERAGQTGAQLETSVFIYALRLTYWAAVAVALGAMAASVIKGRMMTEREKE